MFHSWVMFFLFCSFLYSQEKISGGALPAIAQLVLPHEQIDYYINVHGVDVSEPLTANINQYGEVKVMQSFMDYINNDIKSNHGEYLLSPSGAKALGLIARYFSHLPDATEYLIRASKEHDQFNVDSGSGSTHSLAPIIIYQSACNHREGAHEALVKIANGLCKGYNSRRAIYDGLAYRYDQGINVSDTVKMFGELLAGEPDGNLAKEIESYPAFAGVRQAVADMGQPRDGERQMHDNGAVNPPLHPSIHGSVPDADSPAEQTGAIPLSWIAAIAVLICGVALLFLALKYKSN